MKRLLLALLLLTAMTPLLVDALAAADTFAKSGSTVGNLLYDFEDGTDGFNGKTSVSPIGATHGKVALKLDATGSTGWNQDLALLTNNADWTNAVEFIADVYLPAGTKAAADYVQFIPVFSGPANSWYMPAKIDLHDGANPIRFRVDGKQILTPTKLYLVVNSGKAMPGPIYVDNIRMHLPAKPGRLTVSVVDKAGRPVVGAIVAASKLALTTDASGRAEIDLPGDDYPAEVLGEGITSTEFTASVPSGSSKAITVVAPRLQPPPARPVHVWVEAEKPGHPFDAAKVYGQNKAMWSGLDPFTSQVELKKLRDARVQLVRIPGGEYGNRWDWRTGGIFKQTQAMDLEWTPDATWPVWKQWIHNLGPQTQAMLILNIFQRTPQDSVDWIKDALDSGINVTYVELGNEPDLDPTRWFDNRAGGSTYVDDYVKVAAATARAVRQAFPKVKILGPVIAQIDDRECPGKQPWLCNQYDSKGNIKDDPTHPDWVKKFLAEFSRQGDLLDGLSVHSYPYYPKWLNQPTDVWDAKQAFSKVAYLDGYMAKYHRWLKEYYPAKASRMDIAMTEYNMQVDETWVTADIESAAFVADYLMDFVKDGGTLAAAWDIDTQKVGEGGGHGMLDPNNDPQRPYAERARYWVFKMLGNNFTGALEPAQSSDPHVSVYAAKDRGRTTVLFINRSPDRPAQVMLQASGTGNPSELRLMSLSQKTYLWSKVLYRAVVNEDPTLGKNQKIYAAPVERQGWRVVPLTLDPMSVTLAVFQ